MATVTTLQNSIFLDTSYTIALSTPKDNFHSIAVSLSNAIAIQHPRIITSQGILLEIGNSLSKRNYRAVGVAIVNALISDPRVEVVSLTPSLFADAIQLYSSRPDKEWGMTDCLSFVIMKQYGLLQALTADEHFEQAGFQAIMRR